MSDESTLRRDFKRGVEDAATVLRAHGFRRAANLERTNGVMETAVYVGKNVAFEFGLDARDGYVSLDVIRYHNGQLRRTFDGGYSEGLFHHLIQRCGMRGRTITEVTVPPSAPEVLRSLNMWANLLAEPHAAELLADRADALPS